MSLSASEKKRFLRALEEDIEFRYAVAGYLGLSETLKRLDSLEESMRKLWEEVKKLWEEVKSLRENQEKLWEEVKALRENQEKLWVEVKLLRENDERLWKEVRAIRDAQDDLRAEVRVLREDTKKVQATVGRMSATLERLTLTVEDEARSVIRYRLKQELNVDVELTAIFVDSQEINIYGVAGDLCVIGEATVRLGRNLVEELLSKVDFVKRNRPELLRKRLVKVVYADYVTPDAIEVARDNGVWIVRWDRDLTPLIIENL
jgi:chromosome segregation ATPase